MPGPTGERGLLTASLGRLHLIGASLSLVWLVLPHARRAHEPLILAATLGAYLLGAILLAGGPRLSLRAVQALMLGTTSVISVAAAASGERGSVYGLFYLWATLYAFSFFSRRQALFQVAAVGGAYALSLAVQRASTPWYEDFTRWTLTLGTLIAAGWLVRGLTAQLREREQHLRLGIEQSQVANAVLALDGTVIDVNEAAARLVGASREEVTGTDVNRFGHPDEPPLALAVAPDAGPAAPRAATEVRLVRSDGQIRWLSISASVICDDRGRPQHVFAQFHDITEGRRHVARQAALSRLSGLALHGADAGELAGQAAGILAEGLGASRVALTLAPTIGAAPALVATHGWSRREARAALDAGRLDVPPGGGVIAPAVPVDRAGPWSSIRVAIRTPDGPLGAISGHDRDRRFDREDTGFLEAAASVLAAAEARTRSEDRLRDQATHDALTGLPNRALLQDRLRHALAVARRSHRDVGVLFIDLDHFKVINDSLGQDIGDELLIAVAARLTTVLRESDTLGRLGGDEFMVIGESAADAGHVVRLAERCGTVLREPFTVRGHELTISASIGVARGDGGDDSRALVRHADAAMYRAKALGRARWELFDAALGERVRRRLTAETQLRAALADHHFELAFQPIVTLEHGVTVAAEALLRLTTPDGQRVSPDEIIPIAEENGLIVPIGAWVLEEACVRAAGWQRIARRRIDVSVNLSSRQLSHPDLVEHVRRALVVSGLPAGALILEITESSLLSDAERPLEVLRVLRGLGIRLALDDFGTGYSSLAYLTRLPLDILKLDRAFIARLAPGSQESAVTAAIVQMAAALGLTVIAEGVETREQAAALVAIGVTHAQGYRYARPMSADALERHPAFLGDAAPRLPIGTTGETQPHGGVTAGVTAAD